MSIVKEEAKKLIDKLPDQETWDDIMYEFYVKKKLAVALKAAEEGRIIPHEEVKKRFSFTMKIGWTEPAQLDLKRIRDHIGGIQNITQLDSSKELSRR
jgi:hypothetical protein